MAEEQQQPTFRLKLHRLVEQVHPDGSRDRAHAFVVVHEDGEIVMQDTVDGPQPIIIQSVPVKTRGPM